MTSYSVRETNVTITANEPVIWENNDGSMLTAEVATAFHSLPGMGCLSPLVHATSFA